jgi:hypothetical protein
MYTSAEHDNGQQPGEAHEDYMNRVFTRDRQEYNDRFRQQNTATTTDFDRATKEQELARKHYKNQQWIQKCMSKYSKKPKK